RELGERTLLGIAAIDVECEAVLLARGAPARGVGDALIRGRLALIAAVAFRRWRLGLGRGFGWRGIRGRCCRFCRGGGRRGGGCRRARRLGRSARGERERGQ